VTPTPHFFEKLLFKDKGKGEVVEFDRIYCGRLFHGFNHPTPGREDKRAGLKGAI